MGYIWSNYSQKKRYKISFDNRISPYMEVWNDESEDVYVNIAYRLERFLFPQKIVKNNDEIHQKILNLYKNSSDFENIGNEIFHYVAQLDMKKGFCNIDGISKLEEEAIESDKYGKFVKESFSKIEKKDKQTILYYLAKYDQKYQIEIMLDCIMSKIFDNVNIYKENNTNILHIYIYKPKNEYNENLCSLILYLFSDIQINVEIMWELEHFCLIDAQNSNKISKLAIY